MYTYVCYVYLMNTHTRRNEPGVIGRLECFPDLRTEISVRNFSVEDFSGQFHIYNDLTKSFNEVIDRWLVYSCLIKGLINRQWSSYLFSQTFLFRIWLSSLSFVCTKEFHPTPFHGPLESIGVSLVRWLSSSYTPCLVSVWSVRVPSTTSERKQTLFG